MIKGILLKFGPKLVSGKANPRLKVENQERIRMMALYEYHYATSDMVISNSIVMILENKLAFSPNK